MTNENMRESIPKVGGMCEREREREEKDDSAYSAQRLQQANGKQKTGYILVGKEPRRP